MFAFILDACVIYILIHVPFYHQKHYFLQYQSTLVVMIISQ